MQKIDILNRAKEIAITQGQLAQSPATADKNGKLTLCAASCIARAAIEMQGHTAAISEFDQRVTTEDKNTFVPSIFNTSGLKTVTAERIMQLNDSIPHSRRLSWFQSLEGF